MKIKIVTLLTLLLVFLSSCSSKSIQINPKLTTVGKEDFLSGRYPIAIPPETNTERYGDKLLAVDFKDYVPNKPGAISTRSVETLSTRLQTDLARLKRFTVFSVHNRGGVQTVQRLSDVGDANTKNIEERKLSAVDYVMTASLSAVKKTPSTGRKRKLIYEVEVDYSVEELKTKTVLLAGKALGRCEKTQIFNGRGRQIKGFRDDNEESEKAAMYYAGMKALEVLAHELGMRLPVGGKVISILPSGRFSFDKGAKDGIGSNSQIVLYAKTDGITIGIAVAEADVAKESTTCVPYKWNDSDPDAKPIIKAIKSGGLDKKIKLYAVQYGMPIPEEWNNAYK